MDAFLIIVTIVLSILLIFCSFYLLVLYCHPDDRGWGTSLFCKIVVIAGMTLSWAQVLILPLDVSNSRDDGGLDMQTFWYIVYITIAVLVSIIIPFAQFMYETDDEKPIISRIFTAICYEVILFIVISIAYFISWAYLKYARIPVTVIQNKFTTYAEFIDSSTLITNDNIIQSSASTTLELVVSFPIYVMAFTSFIGNWLFVLFAGVGLYALPIDMIQEFINRPKLRKSGEAMEIKNILKRKSELLIKQGQDVRKQGDDISENEGYWNRRRQNKDFDKQFNEFRVSVLSLERDYEIFKLELNIIDINPAVWFFKLIAGIILLIVSFIWWLHIIIYVLAPGIHKFPSSPFLNKMLTDLEQSGIGFLATAMFAFLSLYLLFCVQKGNIKFGLRIPFIFTVHPMKVNETWMNSFLFNINLVLICSVSVCQFCAKAFSQYTRMTTIDILFNQQVRFLKFFEYFYKENVFEYILIIWSALTCIYLLMRSSDKPQALKQIEELQKIKIK